jgi:pyrroline-5-carboxylate reductase
MRLTERLALLGGAGTMGTALVTGLLRAETVGQEQLVVSARHAVSLEAPRSLGVPVPRDNREAVRGADVIVVCVHPGEVAPVLGGVADLLHPRQLVLSIATGIPTSKIESIVGQPMGVVRANPNLAAVVGASMTVLCAGRHVSEAQLALARVIFSTIGEVELLDERHMNATTALAGCAPAFMFKVIEALMAGGVKMGLPREAAKRIASQVLMGAGRMVLVTGKHPAALKDEVTTPGGCTIDGIARLEELGLTNALISAVETSALKAARLFRQDPED